MGYSSRMECTNIKSDYSAEQLNLMYVEYCKDLREYSEYTFVQDEEYVYIDEMAGFYQNCNTTALAIFLSQICNSALNLWFLGEGGERWGYYIYPGEVYDETYVRGDLMHKDESNTRYGEYHELDTLKREPANEDR